jgi:IS5 family transposase
MGNVPDAKTMVRLGQLLEGDALRQVFDRVVAIAKQKKVSRGRRMRVDSTVVEAPIRPPTDSRLCEGAVRVVRRGMRKLEEAGVELPFARARVRTALSRRMREIAQAKRLAKKNPEALRRPYRGLLQITRKQLKQARCAVEVASEQVKGRRGKKRRTILRELDKLRHFIELGEAVVRQTRARVLGGDTRSEGKLVSIFEPSAQILRRGKPYRPTEFGRLVKVQEAEGGLVTDIEVVDGKNDSPTLVPSVNRHISVFGKPPQLAAADRGYYSNAGVDTAAELGVRRVVVPKPGHKSKQRTALERKRWFQRGRRWRTGGEARISRLKNTFGMHRARYRGARGIERTAYWAGIANNLVAIGTA